MEQKVLISGETIGRIASNLSSALLGSTTYSTAETVLVEVRLNSLRSTASQCEVLHFDEHDLNCQQSRIYLVDQNT